MDPPPNSSVRVPQDERSFDFITDDDRVFDGGASFDDSPSGNQSSLLGIGVADFPAFSWTSPKTILRVFAFFASMIAFSILSSTDGASAIPACYNAILICVFCWISLLVFLVVDYASLYTCAPKLLLELEFAFDTIFFILSFCVAIDIATSCGKTDAEGCSACECIGYNAADKAAFSSIQAGTAFTFFTSFFMLPLAVFSFRVLSM